MSDLGFFVLLIGLAVAAGLWINQREADRRAAALERAESERAAREAWTCPQCGHPVTSEPPYWMVDAKRLCSLSCAREAWGGRP